MTYIKIGEKLYPATIAGRTNDHEWDGRESKTITIEMTYAEAIETLVDGVAWSIVYQGESYVNENGETVTPDSVEYDNTDFCVSGSITDHRDGTVSVKMGMHTELETKDRELTETEAALDEAYEIIYGGM